ncbi:LLM class flavin-dependent oxidoreductase [Rhizohabitans arisaemae]|uniref:LLM class flavin-dependent oxidoreductase n=1 Tax=Rhizohabitans arisaemae TaxID=2720610 RepID=UPI0024B26B97|nr:LLM class flavin-dependent oxidoreductase [Rhizohabitans arisaemae]
MELATSLFTPGATFAQVVEIAVRAEAIGLDHVWIPDEGLNAPDPWLLFGAIAARTDRIGLGVGPTNPYSRHPLVTAHALRTADENTAGRTRLCLVAGGGLALGPLGLRAERPLARLAEAITLTRGHCPGSEIWMAAKGPRMLELAARESDGVMIAGFPLGELAGVVARLREINPGIKLCLRPQLAMDPASYRRQQVELTYALPDSPPDMLRRLGVAPGFIAELRDTVARSGKEQAAELIGEDLVTRFSFVGSPVECAPKIAALAAELHLDQLIIPGLGTHAGYELVKAVKAVIDLEVTV